MADDSIYLWDLGVKIGSNPEPTHIANSKMETVNGDKKFAALTNRHVNPKIVNIELKKNGKSIKNQFSQEFSTLNYVEQYRLGNKFFTSGRYVEAIKLLEMVDFTKLSNKQKTRLMQLHADALFNLGQHNRVVHILTENKEYNLNDELLFLLGLASTELGNKKIALNAFNQIIEKYPLSDYQNIAKLQVRVLKR
ncbi:MAG: hypothetical protein H8E72_07880 [Candidatus Marinimicrobia bacterium]|nr:hypothetical protein [Candidatus Neomarinimicrobiota bacterium]